MSASTYLSNNAICKFISEPPAPKGVEAMNGAVLYPILTGPRPWIFHLEVKYPEMDDSHEINVTIRAKDMEDVHLGPKFGDSNQRFILFELTEEIISALIDGDALISYSVRSDSVTVGSQTLILTVQRIQDKDQPVPVLPQAKGGVLDLREIRQLIRCTLSDIPYASTSMRIWFDLEGIDIDGNPLLYYVLQGRTLTQQEVDQGIDETIDRDFLHLFLDYAAITLIFHVSYKGVDDKNVATELRRDTYQIRQIQQVRLVSENFDALPISLITAGQSTKANTLELELLQGSNGRSGIDTYFWPTPGMQEGNSIVLCKDIHSAQRQQSLKVTFEKPLTRLKFAIVWVQFNLQCELYDESGNLIDDLKLEAEGARTDIWADFSASSGIKTMTVHASDYSFLDFFSMWVKS